MCEELKCSELDCIKLEQYDKCIIEEIIFSINTKSNGFTKTVNLFNYCSKIGEIVKLKCFKIEMKKNVSVDEFKYLFSTSTLFFNLCFQKNYVFDLGFLMELNDVKVHNNTFYITVPHDLTINTIIPKHCMLGSFNVGCELFNADLINSCSIITEGYFFKHKVIRELLIHPSEHNVTYYTKIHNVRRYNNYVSVSFENSKHLKGIIIKGNILEIDKFQISFNEYTYDIDVSKLHKLSNTLYYLSLNIFSLSLRADLYSNTFYEPSNDIIQVNIFTNNNNFDFYVVYKNVLNFVSGYAGFLFEFQTQNLNGHNHIEQLKNKNDWPVVVKPLNNIRDNYCSITHEEIKNDYCLCFDCKNMFKYEGLLREWLKIKNICPMCRQTWRNNVKYKIHGDSTKKNDNTEKNYEEYDEYDDIDDIDDLDMFCKLFNYQRTILKMK